MDFVPPRPLGSDWSVLCAQLMLENLQLRAALGQSVPSWVPEGSIRCGICEARKAKGEEQHNTYRKERGMEPDKYT